jgi:hypothetical protein
MKIEIQVTDPELARRSGSPGDWSYNPQGNKLVIRVARMRDRRSEVATIVHELVEALLCEHNGISDTVVSSWNRDFMNHLDAADPADPEEAPHHRQHLIAQEIESQVLHAMQLDPADHDRNVAQVFRPRAA